MPGRTRLILLFAAIALYQAAMLFFAIPWVQDNFRGYSIDGFPDQYDLVAMNVLEGRGFRIYADTCETLYRMPGYIYLLVGVFFLFGKSLVAVKLTNMAFAFTVAYLLFILGRRITRNDSWSLVAAVIYLLHPATLAAASRGGVETFFTMLIMLFVVTLYHALDRDRLKDYLLLGLVLGVTVFTRSTPMVLPAVLFVYLFIRRRSLELRPVALRVAALSLVAFVVVLPWLVRNYEVAGVFAPKETVAGLSAYNGYYLNERWRSSKSGEELLLESVQEQDRIADELGLPHKPGYIQYFYDTKHEVIFNDHLLDLVTREYLASPVKLVRTLGLNFLRFWFHAGTWNATALNVVLTLPLLLLAVLGTYQAIRRRLDVWPMLLVAVTTMAMHLPVLGVARHHVPFIPFLLILASVPFARGDGAAGARA